MLLSFSILVYLGLAASTQVPLAAFRSSNTGSSQGNLLITPEIDNFVESVLKDYGSSGLSLAVVRRNDSFPNGWLIEYGSYGVAQADGSPVTPDSLFAIASNSKLFLALSVGLLTHNDTLAEERGEKLSWSTKAKGLIPEWELMDKDMEAIVNLQDMVSHRTGMPRHDYSGQARKGGVLEMISTLRYLRTSAEVRETFQYSNLMYETLSYLPPLLLNQSFESYVTENLFDPLDMVSTTYSVADAERSGKFAHGYQRSMRDVISGVNGTLTPTVPYYLRPEKGSIWFGAGGVISSARDLTTWVAMLLSNGKHPFTNETVVPEELINHVAEGVTVWEPKALYPELSATVYGAGQVRYTYQGHELIEHGGANPGFKTQIARYPHDNLGIIILSNDEECGLDIYEIIKWRLTEEILGLERIDWKSRMDEKNAKLLAGELASALPRPSNPSPPTSPIQSMEGKAFHHPAYGTLKPCYVGPKITTSESSPNSVYCARVISDPIVQKIASSYPSTSDDNKDTEDTIKSHQEPVIVPTLVIPVHQFFATHILLRHFSGNIFNGTTIWSNRDVRLDEGYPDDGGDVLIKFHRFEVEWVQGNFGSINGAGEEGLAFKGGFWGSGKPTMTPGGVGKESAEVWFERLI